MQYFSCFLIGLRTIRGYGHLFSSTTLLGVNAAASYTVAYYIGNSKIVIQSIVKLGGYGLYKNGTILR